MLQEKTKFLMGTDITIKIISNNKTYDDIINCFNIFYSFEKEFSRFSKESQLSKLNILKQLQVSNRFLDIFNISKKIFIITNGYFNPLINLKSIGYSENFRSGIFKKKEQKSNNVKFEDINISGKNIILKENQNLDFGGIIKGYCVDLVSDYLKDNGYKDFIVNAGGDIFIYGNNKNGDINTIGIDSPFNIDDLFSTLELKDKAISTSGTYKRNWNIDNIEYHHIIDPNTNTNNNEIISITIISDKCYLADAFATACIAMGIDKAIKFLDSEKIDGVIIGRDGDIYTSNGIEKYNLDII